jgi:plastocyanin
MRVQPKVLGALVLFVGLTLAGCIGGEDNLENEDPFAGIEDAPGLQTQIRIDQPSDSWFEPGTVLNVEAVEPSDAVGNVTYTWAMQPNRWTDFFPSPYYNTSTLYPGESVEITYNEPAFHDAGHCHYHPTQMHTVAVLEGADPPEEPLVVYALEGVLGDESTYTFFPPHITIPPGTTVTYVNAGQIQHTLSIHDWPTPEPVMLDINGRTGQVTLDRFVGDTVDILVFVEDEAGNGGYAQLPVYVRDRLAPTEYSFDGTFELSHDLINADLNDTGVVEPFTSERFTFVWSGTVGLNVTLGPTGLGSLSSIDVELQEVTFEGDLIRSAIQETGAGDGDTFSTTLEMAAERHYKLIVRPAQGLLVDWEVDVLMEYDHTPPEVEVGTACPEPHRSQGHC